MAEKHKAKRIIKLSYYLTSLEDPVNRARSLMQMPVEPVLEGGDEADDAIEMPPAKRPKSGRVVQQAILKQTLGVVPAQTVPYFVNPVATLFGTGG